jgi:hypothetical protein
VAQRPAPGDPTRRGPMHPGVEWFVQPCEATLGFVCERAPWSVRDETGHAYRLILAPLPWDEARSACEAWGGHLATLEDTGEHQFVALMAETAIWIGAEGGAELRWVTGAPLAFQAFAPYEPDGGPERRCVVLGHDERWHDRRCSDTHASVCELD